MSAVGAYDVIVIGAGGAGMAAAVAAADHGARVLLLEADAHVGGSTALSGGVFYAADTDVQRAAGVHGDSAERLYEHFVTYNRGCCEPRLVRVLAERGPDTLEWLESLGVEFKPEDLYVSDIGSVARGHTPTGGGQAISDALERELATRDNVELRLNTRVQKLWVDESIVRGVELNGETLAADAVVVASGGFGHNRALLERYYPDVAAYGECVWSISAPKNRGDGIYMGQQVSAAIQGENTGISMLTADFTRVLEVRRPGWLVFVNREGRRFVDETAGYQLASIVRGQTERSCLALFDETTRRQAASRLTDNYTGYGFRDPWTADSLAQLADAGLIVRRDSLEDLARVCGIAPAQALLEAVAQYNAGCDRREDDMFFKSAAELLPIRTPPYFAVEMKPSIVAATFAGLRIDARARVLSRDESSLSGLYAAGEATGSVQGKEYVGGGTCVAAALIFGLIAGQEAAT